MPSAAAIFSFCFRCRNAAAAKQACGPTRSKGSVENDVCIAPAYGAQAALVRWCVVHHRHIGARKPPRNQDRLIWRSPKKKRKRQRATAWHTS